MTHCSVPRENLFNISSVSSVSGTKIAVIKLTEKLFKHGLHELTYFFHYFPRVLFI